MNTESATFSETVRSVACRLAAILVLAFGPAAGLADGPDEPGPRSGDPAFPVTIRVDASRTKGEMRPVWRFFGHDEPNYTYMKDGKTLLSQLADGSGWARPPRPTPEQYTALERASDLALLGSPRWLHPEDGKLALRLNLPRQAVSLLVFDWGAEPK